MRNGKNVLVCNEVFEPNFNYEDSYNDFFIRNTPQGDSKDDIDLFFKRFSEAVRFNWAVSNPASADSFAASAWSNLI